MTSDLKFEKVEVRVGRISSNTGITISKNKTCVVISAGLVSDFEIEDGTRLDLYKLGETMAFKKCSVGCVKATIAKGAKAARICSRNLVLDIMGISHMAMDFDAYVEGEYLIFKAVKLCD